MVSSTQLVRIMWFASIMPQTKMIINMKSIIILDKILTTFITITLNGIYYSWSKIWLNMGKNIRMDTVWTNFSQISFLRILLVFNPLIKLLLFLKKKIQVQFLQDFISLGYCTNINYLGEHVAYLHFIIGGNCTARILGTCQKQQNKTMVELVLAHTDLTFNHYKPWLF